MSRCVSVKQPVVPKSRLRGWKYIKSLIGKCPICKKRATLGNDILSGKWRVCCMNCTCKNTSTTKLYSNFYMAILEWNREYAERSEDTE